MVIVLYTGYHSKPWNPLFYNETGLGGTEQALMSLAIEFAKKKYDVYVVGSVIEGDYTNPSNSLINESNKKLQNFVKYRTTESFKIEIGNKKIDWIIATSYIHYLEEFKDLNFDQSIFWVHNTDFYPWWNGKELPNQGRDLFLHEKLTHIICQTKWHKNKFIEQFPESKDKIKIIGNGLTTAKIFTEKVRPSYKQVDKLEEKDDIEFDKQVNYNKHANRPKFKHFDKIPYQFVYTSHAERGLAKVLEDWPSIKEKFPYAYLKISTPEYGLEYFEENFLSLLDNLDDVEFLGTLGRQEYIELLKSSEYWYYPSNYEETFCITALEMLACMVKPVTWETAGLKETLHGFNLEDFDDEIDLDAANYYAWRNRWPIVVDKWLKLMKKDLMIDFAYITTIEDNHEHIKDKLTGINIPNEWRYWIKDGFNAKNFTPTTYQQLGVRKNPLWKIDHSVDWYTREVTDGEVGCALSHIDIWQDTYNDAREATLILEDDFKIDHPVPWNEVYELLDEGFDLIYLGRYKVNEIEEKDIHYHHLWVHPEYSYNTHAYVLSKKGAKILVEHWVERYKQNLFALDEFFSILFGKSNRTDILAQFADLPKLKVAAPKINFILQESNRNTTEINTIDYTEVTTLPEEINTIDYTEVTTLPEEITQLPLETTPMNNNYTKILDASNWNVWCQKYINPYILKGQYQLMTDEIGPNIIEFPLFTEEFCKEIIALAEANTWVTDRHYFHPTTDQTMESLGMQEIYQKVLEEFVYPIWIWFWELDGEDWPKLSSENFIAKYDTLNQGSLGIHHDMSVITLNVKLNDDYEGGGTFIPRYKQTYQAKKVGHAMAHPGQITHKHGGRPVTEGTRYILVTFTNKP